MTARNGDDVAITWKYETDPTARDARIGLSLSRDGMQSLPLGPWMLPGAEDDTTVGAPGLVMGNSYRSRVSLNDDWLDIMWVREDFDTGLEQLWVHSCELSRL